jgi:hypothetical protein
MPNKRFVFLFMENNNNDIVYTLLYLVGVLLLFLLIYWSPLFEAFLEWKQ